ncbi:MAG TPA: HPF/RaiA family ribosome-associated protein [Alphaproteobacteria bacterium]|nr:HPF/RaiA family ribosome-associated protein [Alphaproteobacteria bacterium]
MQVPLELAFHGMESSPFIEEQIRNQVDRMERFSDRIISCRVAVEANHRLTHKATIGMKVEITVPGNMIVAKGKERPHGSYDNSQVYAIIRETFDAAIRQLEDDNRKSRREVKMHDGPSYGRVTRLMPEREYGFIETPNGETLFFHAAVVDGEGFDALKPGAEVRYAVSEAEGAYGPQAKSVHLVGPRERA